ncbi:MAG TPA: hypothetical protein VIU10_03400, partial [Candidatus Udaeobacter sp.]
LEYTFEQIFHARFPSGLQGICAVAEVIETASSTNNNRRFRKLHSRDYLHFQTSWARWKTDSRATDSLKTRQQWRRAA